MICMRVYSGVYVPGLERIRSSGGGLFINLLFFTFEWVDCVLALRNELYVRRDD